MKKVNFDGVEILIDDIGRYLQINDICGTDLNRIWKYIKASYKNYDKWFCYHNTAIPFDVLNKIGANLKDDNIEMRLTANNFTCEDVFGIERVTSKNLNEFSIYHDKCNPDMYWTSERIGRDFSRWSIFTLKADNGIIGYILLEISNSAQSEIFCIEALDSFQCEALIKSAVRSAFDSGIKEVLYMADENTIEQKAALATGFSTVGFYKGYKISSI